MSKQFAFNVAPTVNIPRTKFDLRHSHKTTANVGDLFPILVQEVYPGESFKDLTTFVARSSVPFIRPVMDNLFLDTYYFFVPNRLTYDKWKNVMGENTSGYWAETNEISVPMTTIRKVVPGSIANYMGIPVGDYGGNSNAPKVSVLPFRAYALIWNEWFRDQNTQEPCLINFGDITSGSIDYQIDHGNYWDFGNSEAYYLGKVAKANKIHDYFTSALPSPQKGNAIEVPIQGIAPVRTSDEDLITSGTNMPLNFRIAGNNTLVDDTYFLQTQNITRAGESYKTSLYSSDDSEYIPGQSQNALYPSNLYTSFEDFQLYVNDLRYAFQLQKMLEKDARSGTRYTEIIGSHFNTISPDQTLQRPEYLGGKREPLTLHQVAQTSQPTSESPLGQVGAYSLSNGNNGFSKSFTEHGFIIGVAVVRYRHTYQQGAEKFWFRKSRYDYYDPIFANIGEQPIMRRELMFYDQNSENVFGYQEAWADLRYRPSRVSGSLSTQSEEGLDIWHFADFYENAPILNSQFIEENGAFVDRTLSAPSETIPHFIFDFYFDLSAIRPMPPYSIPGLIDHH